MKPTYHHILEPITVGSMELPNRVIMLPMGNGMNTPEGWFSDREIAYFTERAAGGTALVTTAASQVSNDFEGASPNLPAVHSDEALPSMIRLADSIHAVGGKLCFQLTPGLGRNASLADLDKAPISASAVPAFGAPDVICRPLEVDEIHLLVRRMALHLGGGTFHAQVFGRQAETDAVRPGHFQHLFGALQPNLGGRGHQPASLRASSGSMIGIPSRIG